MFFVEIDKLHVFDSWEYDKMIKEMPRLLKTDAEFVQYINQVFKEKLKEVPPIELTLGDKIKEYIPFFFSRKIERSKVEKLYEALRGVRTVIWTQLMTTNPLRIVFTPTNLEKAFMDYLDDWYFFRKIQIPMKEWEDLCWEGLDILRDLLNKNELEDFKNDFRYKKLKLSFEERRQSLASKYYQIRDPMGY